ncbi:MAG: histidine kinase [Terracoccus sp.]
MSEVRRLWGELVRPVPAGREEPWLRDRSTERTRRGGAFDLAVCVLAFLLGLLFLSPTLGNPAAPMSHSQAVVDITGGGLAGVLLWWRRPLPLLVAVGCLLLGTFSISATAPGLFALFSLAQYRPTRPTVFVAALWVPSSLVFGVYSSTTDPVSVLLLVTPLALAAMAGGMFVRARRQLALTLRERAQRAEDDQRLHEDRVRMAERTRIAREMHDVLAHRISLLALHAGALEVSPDLPPAKVRETAVLLRTTARQALEELRAVVGVLRAEPGHDEVPPPPQPTLSDVAALIADRETAGAAIDFTLQVEHGDILPAALGRDVFRIVQESLTNIAKHAEGAATKVRITGSPGAGLHVSVRNKRPAHPRNGPMLPGSGAGLLGLQERVALAGGTLIHGPDDSGDFVVEADLKW